MVKKRIVYWYSCPLNYSSASNLADLFSGGNYRQFEMKSSNSWCICC